MHPEANAPSSPDHDIIAAYLEGSADTQSAADVARRLATDPDFADRFVQQARLSAALRSLGGRRSTTFDPGAEPSPCRRHKWMPSMVSASRRTFMEFWIAAAVLLVMAGIIFIRTRPAERAGNPLGTRMVKCSADGVTVIRNGNRYVGRLNMEIMKGDEFETDEQGNLKIAYTGEDTWIEIAKKTQIAFLDTRVGKRVRLELGCIEVQAAPQPAGRPMVITTPNASAEVLGTRFRIMTKAVGHNSLPASDLSSVSVTRLEVNKGVVRIRHRDNSEASEVAAGEFAIVPSDQSKSIRKGSLSLKPEAPVGIVWKDTCDDITAWRITKWRPPGHIAFDLSPQGFDHSGALRLRYTFPNRPKSELWGRYVMNFRTVDRKVDIPDGATCLRFRMRIISADPGAAFTVWLLPKVRDRCWGWKKKNIAGATSAWHLVELDLECMPQYWHSDTGLKDVHAEINPARAKDIPPLSSGEIHRIEFGLNRGNAEVLIDDVCFVRKY